MSQIQAIGASLSDELNIARHIWPTLQGRLQTALRLLWVLWAVLVLGVFVASLPAYLTNLEPHSAELQPPEILTAAQQSTVNQIVNVASAVTSISAALVSLSLGTLLFLRKSNDGMALFVSFLMLTYGVVLAGPLERLALLWEPMQSVVMPAQTILLATPILLLACLFPSGRFVPSWTRWAVPFSILLTALSFFIPSVDEFSVLSTASITLIVLLVLILPVVAIYAQVYRYRHISKAEEKQQTKWVVYGLGLWFTWIIISSVPYMIMLNQPEGTPVSLPYRVMGLMWWVAMNIVPVSLTISVMRFRLWDVDLVVNRTLVYGILTALVVGIYVLIVGGLGLLFQAQGSYLVALFATGLIAVLFQPLRDRVQRGVNRLVYGDRDDPLAALARLGERLEGTLAAEDVLPTLVQSVAESLKLPYAAISLESKSKGEITVEYGKRAEDLVEFPLVYQNENIGRLQVAPRTPGEHFNPADLKILRNIASQAGVAVHGVQLTIDLRRSQQKLVTAREEERRRLRRDIHDGIGPSLAAYMLAVGSARAALPDNSELADKLLEKLETDLESTLNEIRRLVYNLRPPELDQLGLVGALNRYASEYTGDIRTSSSNGDNPPLITVRTSQPGTALPAAVETAAYRITQEALNNVVRHARAENCEVTLEFSDALTLTIRDDGSGMPGVYKAGIGLASMKERSYELGGTFRIISQRDRGTTIIVELPLKEMEEFQPEPKK